MGNDPAVSLRPVTDEDGEFLYQVYASTRAEELALVDWNDAQKEVFVRQQFEAQRRHFLEHYPDAAYQVILIGGRPAGRLYLTSAPGETRIVDIALLPDLRGLGVGTTLLGDVLADARPRGACVTAHVERFNRALGLYSRLGFVLVQDLGVYLFLRWQPQEQLVPPDPAASA